MIRVMCLVISLSHDHWAYTLRSVYRWKMFKFFTNYEVHLISKHLRHVVVTRYFHAIISYNDKCRCHHLCVHLIGWRKYFCKYQCYPSLSALLSHFISHCKMFVKPILVQRLYFGRCFAAVITHFWRNDQCVVGHLIYTTYRFQQR